MRLFLFFIIIFSNTVVKSQQVDTRGMDISFNGYIFLTDYGLFFQPLDYFQNKNFVLSLNKLSFRIDEPTDVMNYSPFLKGVGYKLPVKKYFEDTINKNPTLNITDTVTYFKCSIEISMQFFDTSYTSIREVGYGFVLNNQFIYYGNLAIRNQLYKIIPEDVKILEQFYNSYLKKKISPPEWLKVLYVQRKVKRK
jgi:hypothetical protein